MAILLLAEHDGSSLNDQTAKALSAASKIGGDVHVLVAGSGAKAAADAAAKLAGVSKVLLADDAGLANNLAEPLSALIVSLAGSYDTIIAAATASAKNVMPRVAALLDVMQISEIIEVVSADTFKRPIYAGNAIQTVQSTDAKKSDHGAHRLLPGGWRRRLRLDRVGLGCGEPGPVELRFGCPLVVRTPGTDLCEDHHFRRPRTWFV
jgi:hypothetical protein